MSPDQDLDAVLSELEERRRRAAMSRLARSLKLDEERPTRHLRRALGSVLIRLGVLVSGAGVGGLRPPARQEQQATGICGS
jgi:hypothetical protein